MEKLFFTLFLTLFLTSFLFFGAYAQEEGAVLDQLPQAPQNLQQDQKDAEKSNKTDSEKMDKMERDKYEPRISDKWFRGNYLIYDCEKGNFICVNLFSFNQCQSQREEDKKQKQTHLRCAPFKKFPTQKKCFAEQYRQIENQKPKVFCSHF